MVHDLDHRVVLEQVEDLAVVGVHVLDGDGALGGGDADTEDLLCILEDGVLDDLGRKVCEDRCQEVVLVEDEGLTLELADALEMVEVVTDIEARQLGDAFVRDDALEGPHLRGHVDVVSLGGLLEGLDVTEDEVGHALGLPDDLHALALDGLDIAVQAQHADGLPQCVVGAVILLHQHGLGRDERLVGELTHFDTVTQVFIDLVVDCLHSV